MSKEDVSMQQNKSHVVSDIKYRQPIHLEIQDKFKELKNNFHIDIYKNSASETTF